MRTHRLVALALLLAAGGSAGQEPTPASADRSRYTIFDPVPDALLRELDVDRPDKSNSPHTVDAGHFLVETGIAFTRRRDSDVRTNAWTWADTSVRIGLTHRSEIQLALPLYEVSRDFDRTAHETERSRGIGDLVVVGKRNLWGNDGGDSAGGVELFLELPTAAGDGGVGEVGGGATVLLGVRLPAGFDVVMNAGVAVRDDEGGARRADVASSVCVSHDIAGPLSGYVEFFGGVPANDASDWDGTVDVGAIWRLGRSWQLDAGVNVGVSHEADDLQAFAGAAVRF
jgi:hypothetical protein